MPPITRIFDRVPESESLSGARIYHHVTLDRIEEPVSVALDPLRAIAAVHQIEVTEEILDIGSAAYGFSELLAHIHAKRCALVICHQPAPLELTELDVTLVHPAPPTGDSDVEFDPAS